MKRLFLIILLITVFISANAGCSGQTSENANVTQENTENVYDGTDNANSSIDHNNSISNKVDNQDKTESVKAMEEAAKETKSDASSSAGEKSAAKNTAGVKKSSAAGITQHNPQVTLWVTQDFAQKVIFAREVPLETGAAVMDVLKSNMSVETQYGGGFVNSINGLASGYTGADKKTRDWFYYVNGIMTSVGALDYKPSPGELIWWDYHDWGASAFTPALVGAFPEPFRTGYRGTNPGTLILVAAGFEQQGEKLAAYLSDSGIKQVNVKPYSASLLSEDKKIAVVIGLWSQFKDDQYWQGLQKQRKKTGLFVELNEEYFAALDDQGEQTRQYKENAGAIVATGTGMGDNTPVWLITGLDTTGLIDALNILINNPRSIKQHFGALVAGGQVIAVPAAR